MVTIEKPKHSPTSLPNNENQDTRRFPNVMATSFLTQARFDYARSKENQALPPDAEIDESEQQPITPEQMAKQAAEDMITAVATIPSIPEQAKQEIIENNQLKENLEQTINHTSPFGMDYKQAVGSFLFGGGAGAASSKIAISILTRKALVAGSLALRSGGWWVGVTAGTIVGGGWAAGREYFNEQQRIKDVRAYLEKMSGYEPVQQMQEYLQIKQQLFTTTSSEQKTELYQRLSDIEVQAKQEQWKDLQGMDRLQKLAELRSVAGRHERESKEFQTTTKEMRRLWKELDHLYSTTTDKKRITLAALKGAAIGAIGGAASNFLGHWLHQWWEAHQAATEAVHAATKTAAEGVQSATEKTLESTAAPEITTGMNKTIWNTVRQYSLSYAKEHGISPKDMDHILNSHNYKLLNDLTRSVAKDNGVEITGDHGPDELVAKIHEHLAHGIKDTHMPEGTKLHFESVKNYLDSHFGSHESILTEPTPPIPEPIHPSTIPHSPKNIFKDLLIEGGILAGGLALGKKLYSLGKNKKAEHAEQNQPQQQAQEQIIPINPETIQSPEFIEKALADQEKHQTIPQNNPPVEPLPPHSNPDQLTPTIEQEQTTPAVIIPNNKSISIPHNVDTNLWRLWFERERGNLAKAFPEQSNREVIKQLIKNVFESTNKTQQYEAAKEILEKCYPTTGLPSEDMQGFIGKLKSMSRDTDIQRLIQEAENDTQKARGLKKPGKKKKGRLSRKERKINKQNQPPINL